MIYQKWPFSDSLWCWAPNPIEARESKGQNLCVPHKASWEAYTTLACAPRELADCKYQSSHWSLSFFLPIFCSHMLGFTSTPGFKPTGSELPFNFQQEWLAACSWISMCFCSTCPNHSRNRLCTFFLGVLENKWKFSHISAELKKESTKTPF